MSFTETKQPLSSQNKKSLKLGIFFSLLVAAIFAVGFFVMASQADDLVFSIFVGVLFLFAFGILFYIIRGLVLSLHSQQKKVYLGHVIEKEERSSSNSGRRKSSNKKSFYLRFEKGKEIEIQRRFFHSCYVGDLVEIHLASHLTHCLEFKVVEQSGGASLASGAAPESKKSVSGGVFFEPLSTNDRTFLKEHRDSQIKRQLVIFGFLFFMIAGFIGQGFWGIVIFLFPIPLAMLWSLFKIFRAIRRYSIDLSEGKKRVATLRVEDKVSRQRGGRSLYLKLEGQLFLVKESEFNRWSVGDTVMVEIAPKSGIVLQIR